MLNIPAPVRPVVSAAHTTAVALLDAFVATVRPLVARVSTDARHIAVIRPSCIVIQTLQKGRIGPSVQLADGERAPDVFRSGEVQLRLPPEVFLTRTLRLPNAGRGYLQPIIAHRLERLTPWRTDKVLYGYHVVEGVSEDGTIGVELLATSVDLAEPFLARLSDVGLTATALGSAAEPLDAPLRFNLYSHRTQATDVRFQARIARIFIIGLAALVAASLFSAFLAASAASDAQALEQRLATLRAKLAARGGSGTQREHDLIAAKRVDSAAIVLIDTLSRVLPDDTVLRELDIDQTRVRLVGRSADAPALIARLEADTGLKNPRFAAPVIRDTEKRDVFDLIAVRGEAPDAAR